eukprot:6175730-Pleurochrysis_carterae.AAC.1
MESTRARRSYIGCPPKGCVAQGWASAHQWIEALAAVGLLLLPRAAVQRLHGVVRVRALRLVRLDREARAALPLRSRLLRSRLRRRACAAALSR